MRAANNVMMSSLGQNDSMSSEKLRSSTAVKPQPLENQELYDEDDPKKVAVFSTLVAEDFLGEDRPDASPHQCEGDEGSLADAAAVGTGEIFVVAENQKGDEVEKEEQKD